MSAPFIAPDEGRINLNVWLDQAVQPINICGDSASRNPPDDGAEWDGVIIGDYLRWLSM